MNAQPIIPFSFENHSIRAINRDGDIWFVATDVCAVLEIQNVSQAMSRLDNDERSMFNIGRSEIHGGGGEKNTLTLSEGIHEGAGNPNVNIINESGLYALILRSRKPEAKRFRKWVTSEVLPSIRKTGSYGIPTININAALLDDLEPLSSPLPPDIERSARERAIALTCEAYEVIHEHVRRRAADMLKSGANPKYVTSGITLGNAFVTMYYRAFVDVSNSMLDCAIAHERMVEQSKKLMEEACRIRDEAERKKLTVLMDL